MLTDITLGQYFPGKSPLHLLDSRTKIINTVLFITAVFFADNYLTYGIVTAFTLITVLMTAIPLRMILKSVRPLWVIILLTLLVHVFSTPGQIIFHAGPFAATAEGIRQGTFMTLRLVLLIIMSSLLTFTTSPIALTDGLERLLSPFKRVGLPAHELAMMMTIALRFIPTLLEETDRIMKAQIARGADFSSGNIIKRAKNMVPLLVPLFVSAFRRADDLATAMEARCYRGGENRTRMKELKMTGKDIVAFAIVIVLLIVLAGLKIVH
ncbi:MAG: energy-coupling factor transporter transmembrane protein EcfT [Pelosinus sp.]|nr:energy-coupling factor transporter transmembrane protein EcfT [Pelosinus sp.]